MTAPIHAILIAVLLCVPSAALAWDQRRTNQSPRSRTPLLFGFAAGVALAAVAVSGALYQTIGAVDPPLFWRAIAFAGAALACVALTPKAVVLGPIAYFLTSYLFDRSAPLTLALIDCGLPTWLAFLTLYGAVLARFERPREAPPARVATTVCLSIFACWLAVTIVAAVVAGRPLSPDLLARATRYGQAIAICLALAVAPIHLREVRGLTLAMGVLLVVRHRWLTASALFDQNLAMLTAIVLPLTGALAVGRPWGGVNAVLAAAGVYLAVLVVAIQNRGAAVGVAVAALVMWAVSRYRWRWAAVGVIAVAPVLVWAATRGLFRRFSEIYVDGQFVGSAGDRIEIWTGGVRMALEHWAVGVGPGNFAEALARYSSGRTIPAHNTLVEILAELGIAGFVIYVALFGSAVWSMVTLSRRADTEWRRIAAVGLLGALTAHVIAGGFLSNANLVWSYALLGVAASLVGHAAPTLSPSREEVTERD